MRQIYGRCYWRKSFFVAGKILRWPPWLSASDMKPWKTTTTPNHLKYGEEPVTVQPIEYCMGNKIPPPWLGWLHYVAFGRGCHIYDCIYYSIFCIYCKESCITGQEEFPSCLEESICCSLNCLWRGPSDREVQVALTSEDLVLCPQT